MLAGLFFMELALGKDKHELKNIIQEPLNNFFRIAYCIPFGRQPNDITKSVHANDPRQVSVNLRDRIFSDTYSGGPSGLALNRRLSTLRICAEPTWSVYDLATNCSAIPSLKNH